MINTYGRALLFLQNSAQARFKAYHEKTANTAKPVLGVSVPRVREIAKIVLKGDYLNYLKSCEFNYFEDIMLYGFVVASLSYGEFLKYLPIFLAKADSWAHIDSFVAAAKCIGKNKADFMQKIKSSVLNSSGFTLRFYIVCLMNYYLDGEYLDYAFEVCQKCDGKGYYTDLAIAWLISVAFVKFKDKTFDFIKNCNLTNFTLNKSISKINDSFRVSRENKILLQKFRRKD